MEYRIAVLPGDGVGPEVVAEGVKVLHIIAELYDMRFTLQHGLVGGAAIDALGDPLPEATLQLCRESDAVLFGSVGGPKWDALPADKRPERGLLRLRQTLDLFANLRPAKLYNALLDASSLRPEVVPAPPLGPHASVLWRREVTELAGEFGDVELEHLYVDNCAMQLVRAPRQFDVIVTGNLFGDILSDEAAMLTGSIGMLPSASIGGTVGVFEPVHGSAPDIAGQNIANPIATINSVAMLLQYALRQPQAASAIEAAVENVLHQGYRTADIMGPGCTRVGTTQMGDAICTALRTAAAAPQR